MTGLAKILVVFTAALSLGFAAFAFAMFAGGPNWDLIAAHAGLSEAVQFDVSETGSHSAKLRVTDEQVGSSEIQADVILKAQARVLRDLNEKVQRLQAEIPTLTTQRETLRTQTATDRNGLSRHGELWAEQLKALAAQITQVTDELADTGVKAQQLLAQLRELGFEVLRLQNQLELLRDDQFAAEEQRRALESELLQLRESRLRLERRQAGLKQQLEGAVY